MLTLNTKRILVPYDFSTTANKALKHAALIAQSSHGELLLFYARRNTSGIALTRSMAELRQMAEESANYRKMMENPAAQIRTTYNIPVKMYVGLGHTIHQIKLMARKRKAGLIVMGTNGTDSANNVFTGSISHRVVSHSDVPVLTVRNESNEEGYSKILLPIDLSEHTRQKVIIAIQMARIFGASIHLLGILTDNQVNEERRLQAILQQVKKRIEEDEIKVDQEVLHTSAAIARTLMCAKRVKADLIISMTDQETSSMDSLFSTSYNRALIDESGIPVLSIPPEINEENVEPASIGGLW